MKYAEYNGVTLAPPQKKSNPQFKKSNQPEKNISPPHKKKSSTKEQHSLGVPRFHFFSTFPGDLLFCFLIKYGEFHTLYVVH
jgi:hypothetical protein